jgi:hypothetical protein
MDKLDEEGEDNQSGKCCEPLHQSNLVGEEDIIYMYLYI